MRGAGEFTCVLLQLYAPRGAGGGGGALAAQGGDGGGGASGDGAAETQAQAQAQAQTQTQTLSAEDSLPLVLVGQAVVHVPAAATADGAAVTVRAQVCWYPFYY